MNEKEKEIFLKVSELFLTLGIKSLTMKDIASKLGISKKTLYTFVKDKNDLVVKCMNLNMQMNLCDIESACVKSSNAIEEVISFSKIASEKLSIIHPSIFHDLQKYHPEAWEVLEKFENKTFHQITSNNLVRGMKEGLYREDLNISVISHLYVSLVQSIFRSDPPTPINLSRPNYYNEIFNYHIRGIASEKGIQIIKELIN